MGRLAEIHEERGLPRGRGSLAPEAVTAAQRSRLLRAIVAAVAERGYANVRIADVVDRARVSRQSFYAQFADKEQCFLAAHDEGIELILSRLRPWALQQIDAPPAAQLHQGLGAYLRLVRDEPEFAWCMMIELQAIGPAGLEARVVAHRQMAGVLRLWHQNARRREAAWPAVPDGRYAAAIGAVHDLVFAAVAQGTFDAAAVSGVTDAAADAVRALLQVPPPD